MDLIKTGKFLARLRREAGYTQERLGEKLGVSNKTVSRWETGAYLPPVEMLQAISDLYGVSINELLAGERLEGEAAYRAAAEENLTQVMRESTFSLEERRAYYNIKRSGGGITLRLCSWEGFFRWRPFWQRFLQIWLFCGLRRLSRPKRSI